MLNNCQFIGHLGRDPEIRHTPSGDAVVTINVACTEKWKDKGGQQQERTEWVRGVAFGRLAEIMEQYLSKGSLVYISGKMQTRKWQAQDGSDRYTTEINIREMKMLGGRGNDGQPATHQERQQQLAAQTDDFDDDIPF